MKRKRKSKKQQPNSAMTAFAAILVAGLIASTAATYMSPMQPDYDMDAYRKVIEEICKKKKEPKPQKPITADNNAGNLRGANGEFKTFRTAKQGYDALVSDIKTKISGDSRMMKAKLGENYKPTLKNVLTVYAPPTENNTKHYISFVASRANINPNKPLTIKQAYRIVPHMIVMEKGHKGAAKFKQYVMR